MAIRAESNDVISITNTDDAEDSCWQMTEKLHTLQDYLESGEVLQVRQSFADMKAHMEALEAFIESLPTESANAEP